MIIILMILLEDIRKAETVFLRKSVRPRHTEGPISEAQWEGLLRRNSAELKGCLMLLPSFII